MSSKLMTTWAEHDAACADILGRAQKSLCIFDKDLSCLKLENPANASLLRQFLATDPRHQLQIVLRDAQALLRNSPRLLKLMIDYPQNMIVFERSADLATLNDALLMVDGIHALVRFHQEQVRSKIIIDDSQQCRPYLQRFSDILNEGGERISPTPLGL